MYIYTYIMNKNILLQYIYISIYIYTYTYVHVFVYAFICEFRCIHVFLSSWITSRQNVAQLSGTLRTGRRTRPTPTDCIRRLDWGWRLQRTWRKTMGLSTSLPVGPPWNLTKKSSGMYNLTVSGDGSNATGHRFQVKRLQHIWIKGHRKHPKIFPYSWWYNDILLFSFYS